MARIREDTFQEAFLSRRIVNYFRVRLKLILEMLFYLCNIASPHNGQGRTITPGQKVHSSIAFCDKNYRPKASLLVPQPRPLCDLVGRGSRSSTEWVKGWEDLIEMDIFDLSLIPKIIEALKSRTMGESSMWAYRLKAMASTGKYLFTLE